MKLAVIEGNVIAIYDASWATVIRDKLVTRERRITQAAVYVSEPGWDWHCDAETIEHLRTADVQTVVIE